jgi:hypothetical protein
MKRYIVVRAPVYEVIIFANSEMEALAEAGKLPITAYTLVEDYVEADEDKPEEN